MSWARALGLALGFAADRAFGDPQRWHPVAGFGTAASEVEKAVYADSKAAGVAAEVVLVGGAVALALAINATWRHKLERGAGYTRRHVPLPGATFVLQVAATAAATFVVLGGTTLGREASAVAERLEADDLKGARTQVGRIVGRSTAELTPEDIARATVETVAENTTDAVVAPLFWGAVAGVPGLLGYRAINTLDAMFGHKSERYLNFGWAAARTDDAANWIPARLSASLVALVCPDKAKQVWRTIRRDAAKHPSPNAGQVESAFAAALDVQLGGANTYHGVTEDRGTLGDGDAVQPRDVSRAVRLSRAVGTAAAAAAVVASVRRR